MGMIFEELIRKFSELSNEISGEHFTPREVIRLMVSLLFIKDNEVTTREGIIRKLYDPTAGTGGMLSAAEEHLRSINPSIQIMMCGQEINSEAYAICKADMLIKGQDIKNISLGNTLSNDQHCTQKYDYMLSNPPFGVEWRNAQEAVKAEHFSKGFTGRFGPGLPRISDGSLLFLMHLISKMQPRCNGGSRIAIVLNGSPMFIGGAGSGESQIRRHIFENDLVEAIIQLPEELFYNTSISTYIWIITNKKSPDRTGKVQLIDASCFSTKLSKSLGKKRKTLEDFHISKISEIFKSFKETSQDGKSICKILNNEDFGYRSITIDRPININGGKPIVTKQYKPKADRDLREIEILPLSEEIEKHLEQEVLPNHPDAWIEKSKTKIGYQVLFNRFFYKVKSHKSLKELDKEIKDLACSIAEITEDILQ
ncbi:Type I restriction-modification system [Prochlorococcus sp. MIT 0602]|nr:Type I restriction-modification system [Prochlorococcus sp. MIT 0602]